ncbi:D-amino acid dehydrogenase [Aquicella siphonis]|uniref:D-amino-acid oxidase n=1 Tax=Aquicella siphonis TaxID=254247 RepID=A0A5E4PKD5_9COXI|nr:FAD-dependent oxidoreductase [Aquicella siphonis]VVC77015.1 D-amino acid dehydrogenase [Aquicella siphonis]
MNAGIAGAGIMGRMLAYALVSAGHSVTLFDHGPVNDTSNCSHAAAGLLMPVSELEKTEILIYRLGRQALLSHWPDILKEIGHHIYFRSQGSLALSHPRDVPELRRFVSHIDARLHDHLRKHTRQSCPDSSGEMKNKLPVKLSHDEILRIEPQLTQFDEVYYIPDEGQIDSQAVMGALREYLLKNHVFWRSETRVTAVADGKIRAEDDEYAFDLVFDCRGLGARSRFEKMCAVRGESIWLHAPEVDIRYPVKFHHPRYNLYLAPRPDHVYIIGASEIHADDMSNISVRTTLELLTAVYSLHPGFAEARLVKTVAHCRPALHDFMPEIRHVNGCVAINGLYRHGFLIAPALAAEIMRWISLGQSACYYPEIWRTA